MNKFKFKIKNAKDVSFNLKIKISDFISNSRGIYKDIFFTNLEIYVKELGYNLENYSSFQIGLLTEDNKNISFNGQVSRVEFSKNEFIEICYAQNISTGVSFIGTSFEEVLKITNLQLN